MKITVLSDIHLEFGPMYPSNPQGADVLVLSGDITLAEALHQHPPGFEHGPNYNRDRPGSNQTIALRTREFFDIASKEFAHVVYVAGNHEFYHGKWHAAIDYLREETSRYSNVHYLENDSFTVNNVTFAGGTLWTDMNNMDPLTLHSTQDMLNDFSLIRNDQMGYRSVKPAETVVRHRTTLKYIKEVALNIRERADPTARLVVVGHHSPCFMSCAEQYRSQYLMNGAYHSDLSEFILDHPEIVLWTHGHVHNVADYMIGDCRVVCNPRGYVDHAGNEYTGWDEHKVIEI